MTATVVDRPPVSGAALSLLERARSGLREACYLLDPADRYIAAHLAALRAAAAVLAVRGRADGRRPHRPRSVWEVLPRVAPELTEWATFFSAGAPVRSALEAGRTHLVEGRAADDLLRDAESFTRVVTELVGLPWQPVLPPSLPSSG
ncbi:MAG: SAV_6107 family HEPN domain-containing protein [Actinomycetales bacterium]